MLPTTYYLLPTTYQRSDDGDRPLAVREADLRTRGQARSARVAGRPRGRRGDPPHPQGDRRVEEADLQQPHRLADDPGGAAPETAAHRRLHRPHLRRLRR